MVSTCLRRGFARLAPGLLLAGLLAACTAAPPLPPTRTMPAAATIPWAAPSATPTPAPTVTATAAAKGIPIHVWLTSAWPPQPNLAFEPAAPGGQALYVNDQLSRRLVA